MHQLSSKPISKFEFNEDIFEDEKEEEEEEEDEDEDEEEGINFGSYKFTKPAEGIFHKDKNFALCSLLFIGDILNNSLAEFGRDFASEYLKTFFNLLA